MGVPLTETLAGNSVCSVEKRGRICSEYLENWLNQRNRFSSDNEDLFNIQVIPPINQFGKDPAVVCITKITLNEWRDSNNAEVKIAQFYLFGRWLVMNGYVQRVARLQVMCPNATSKFVILLTKTVNNNGEIVCPVRKNIAYPPPFPFAHSAWFNKR